MATTKGYIATTGRGIYKYDAKRIDSFLKFVGHEGEVAHYIKRNSDGSALVFILGNAREAVVASCDGTLRRVALPSDISWVNDELKVVSWSDARFTYFGGGRKTDGLTIPYHFDPSGKYFIRPRRTIVAGKVVKVVDERTKIYAVAHLDKPMANIHMTDARARIFLRGDKLSVVGDSPTRRNVINIHVFKIRENSLVPVDKKSVIRPNESPAPFGVVDASPWDDSVLLIDGHDFPRRSKWYVYRMSTNQLEYVGHSSRYGFYLQCDPLHQVGLD